MSTNNEIHAQFETLIATAKSQKSVVDMAKLDYRHTMKKLSILSEQYPSAALQFNLVKGAKTEE